VSTAGFRTWTLGFSGLLAAALAVALLAPAEADAQCQVQWEPDPFGDSGGSLGIVCGDPNAPTGNVGSESQKKEKKKRKPPPSFASMAVNMTTLNDGDLSFAGSTSAGYATKQKAVRASVRACHRDEPGVCKSLVTARNGWAALVATLDPDQRLVVFAGNAKGYFDAFAEAEERAREAFGGTAPYEIQRVRAVRSRAR
jgi:hypothetical protein